MELEIFSRYTDNKDTLFVIIKRLGKVVIGDPSDPKSAMFFEPTTIDLLNVNAEKMNTISVKTFMEYLEKGILKKVKK